MPALHLLLSFAVTTALFAFIPGPAMLYAAARTVAGGRRQGVMAALGIHVGGYAHVAAAAAGLTALLHVVPLLYAAVKLGGAAYLVWLGVCMLRSRTGASGEAPGTPAPGRHAFGQSVLVELLNPKTALFYVALLPQFADPAAAWPVWTQLVVLGTTVNAMFSAADLAAVALAGTVMARLRRSSRARTALQRTGGAILVGLGVRLAVERA